MSLPRISMISIDVTDRCSLRCHHCRSHLRAFEAPTSEMLHIVEEIVQLRPRIVVISGGEPLLRRDLFEIIAAIRLHGAAVQLNTNGLGFSESVADQVARAGVEYVQISVEGPAAVHESIRGPGTWARAIAACRRVREPARLVVNTTVSRYNLPYLQEAAELLLGPDSPLDVHVWGLKRYVPFNNLADGYALGADGLAHLAHVWGELRARYPDVAVKTDIPQANRLDPERVRAMMARHGIACAGCAAGAECLTVRANGDVSPCPTLYVTCGNLHQMSVHEVLAHPVLHRLREREGFAEPCESCADRLICGGCRAMAYASSGDVFGPDPECYRRPRASADLAPRRSDEAPPQAIGRRRRRGGGAEPAS